MQRMSSTKMRRLDVLHPGLIDKVEAMFAEFCRPREVKQMIRTQYGERLGLTTVERYKRQHWQARRKMVQEMSQIIGRPSDPMIG
jgi:hypothetical protein